ncbi:hypothetical protein [Alteribacillus persepolensis]|uniref:hypothetical protein n=1 Tax=Alteribacillus persepolensis TaxID=568899 RepID=UPI001587BBA3|nr:hypothetical protein [Alteribacillus persepolensis]
MKNGNERIGSSCALLLVVHIHGASVDENKHSEQIHPSNLFSKEMERLWNG